MSILSAFAVLRLINNSNPPGAICSDAGTKSYFPGAGPLRVDRSGGGAKLSGYRLNPVIDAGRTAFHLSEMGQPRRFRAARHRSALPPIATEERTCPKERFVPKAAGSSCSKPSLFDHFVTGLGNLNFTSSCSHKTASPFGQTTFSCSAAFDDARRGRDPFLDVAARRSAWITRAFRLVLRSAVFGGDSAFRNGASRPMKMGITASLWRYDGAAHTRPSRVNGDAQRFSIHLVGADLPDSAGWSAHRARPSWSFRIDARPADGLRFCVREDCSLQLARVGTQPGIPYVRGECCPCSR
jgi:hypothetical protein